MTLATHAVAGAAVASLVTGNVPVAFALAVASHYALDAIPHRDYDLRSRRSDENNRLNEDLIINRAFFFDLLKLSFDFALGIAIAILFAISVSHASLGLVFVGVIGGVLPDGLQFVYMKTDSTLMVYIQRFHHYMHYKHCREELNVKPIVGFCLQALVAVAVMVCAYLIIRFLK